MDGGESRDPFMRRHGQKRSFSAMAASHRDSSSPTRDDHYANEHAARRRRHFENELRGPRVRFPGDGLDYRRPIMSTAADREDEDGDSSRGGNTGRAVIDLTDDDSTPQASQQHGHPQPSVAGPEASTHASLRSTTLRNVIELESSGEDDDGDDGNAFSLPGAHYLALPARRPRSQFASLRRPQRLHSPATDMDDIQFIEQRPRSRLANRATHSRSTTPRLLRHATPYPANSSETIDLTEDNDDEIVHVNTRQREGVNSVRPETTAGAGTWSYAERGYGNVGGLVNLLRERGAHLGGRLAQRIQDFAGNLEPEERARQATLEVLEEQEQRENYLRMQRQEGGARPRHHHHHHHHHHHVIHGNPNVNPHMQRAQQLRAQVAGMQRGIAHMMNYDMTGFDMGLGGGHRPPTPKYEPPPPAQDGFTRSPQEDEVVVCPNCGDELATGKAETKQEIWAIKACGHVYCGECARNRAARPISRKGKANVTNDHDSSLPRPFKRCVVKDCDKPAAKNSMIHVFLGS